MVIFPRDVKLYTSNTPSGSKNSRHLYYKCREESPNAECAWILLMYDRMVKEGSIRVRIAIGWSFFWFGQSFIFLECFGKYIEYLTIDASEFIFRPLFNSLHRLRINPQHKVFSLFCH